MSQPPTVIQELLEASDNPTAKTKPIYHFDTDACDPLPDEESSMRIANKVRMLVVTELTKGGKSIPDDPKEVKALLAAADGIDRQALGRQRLKTDQTMVDAARQAILLADELFSDRDALVARARGAGGVESILKDAVLPEGFVPIAGQTEINPPQETFESFRSRMKMR